MPFAAHIATSPMPSSSTAPTAAAPPDASAKTAREPSPHSPTPEGPASKPKRLSSGRSPSGSPKEPSQDASRSVSRPSEPLPETPKKTHTSARRSDPAPARFGRDGRVMH